MNNNLELELGELFTKNKITLATAESCTGGLIGHRITNVPGSSKYFERGVIVYSNDAKIALLKIPAETLERYGAVSPETARAMADGIKALAQTDLGLAVTGIAGPSGGTADKPVGLVYIALATAEGTESQEFRFEGTRDAIKAQTADAALEMVVEWLVERGRNSF